MHGTSLLSTPGQSEPVLLPILSKKDEQEHCFLEWFGFSISLPNCILKKPIKTCFVNSFFFYFSSLTCWVHFICAPTLETRNEETSVCTKKKPKLKVNSLIFLHSFVRNTEFKTTLKFVFCCCCCFFALAIP